MSIEKEFTVKLSYRRFSIDRQPFMTGFIAIARLSDGRFYARGTSFSREFVRDVLREHGAPTLRRFWLNMRDHLADGLIAECNRVRFDAQQIDLVPMSWTYEEMCSFLGIAPKLKESA